MKKLFLILCLFVFASNAKAYDYTSMCSCEPYPVGGAFPRFMSIVTGTNLLFTSVAEGQIEKALKKDLDSKFDVQIKAFGGKNLLDGKFQSLALTSKKVNYNGSYVSDFKAETLCRYNHIVRKSNNEIYFPENLLLKYSGTITSEDFAKSVVSRQYLSVLDKCSVSIGTKVMFKIFDPQAKINNGRIYISYKIMTPFSGDVSEVKLNTKLTVENEKIVFSDVEMGSSNSKLNFDKILPLVNKLNPFTSELRLSKNAKAISKIMTVNVKDDKINFTGLLIVPKNYSVTK